MYTPCDGFIKTTCQCSSIVCTVCKTTDVGINNVESCILGGNKVQYNKKCSKLNLVSTFILIMIKAADVCHDLYIANT